MSFGKAGTMHDWTLNQSETEAVVHQALEIRLIPEDIAFLEEPYVPHPIVGAIDRNPMQGVILLDEKK